MSYLNGKERTALLRVLNKLPTPAFQKLLITINAPRDFSSYESLLKWVESQSGCGLEKFLAALDKLVVVRKKLPEPDGLSTLHETPQYSFPTEKIIDKPAIAANQFIAPAFSTSPSNTYPRSKAHTNGQKGVEKIDIAQPKGSIYQARKIAKSYQQELGNYTSLEMIYIPGGNFWMGSSKKATKSNKEEHPQHKVKVSAFYMSKYPVTQHQWYAVSLLDDIERELKPYPSRFQGDNLPVENISWYDAVEFCQRLSHYTSNDYRLPSEAEWEYACRAGTSTPFYFGETIATDHANYNGTHIYGQGRQGIHREKTTPVDLFLPNSFGLHDMHGNVWEWCQDYWHDNYTNAPKDSLPWVQGGNQKYRVLRGGCWYGLPEFCRTAFRCFNQPNYHDDIVGMRIVCSSLRVKS